MIKVITYGTFDLLHYGHIRLLERAKALGDYLIVGITSDDYDKTRGKINNRQSLMERVEAVKSTGIADKVIVEEYDGQKIDDIKKYGIDIFTVGSDWEGKFDYLNTYCKVVYLQRTEGVSSSNIRSESRKIRIGILSDTKTSEKFIEESKYVNGIFADYCSSDMDDCDAVYVVTDPEKRYEDVKKALNKGKNVLCEGPVTINAEKCKELFNIAREKKLVLVPSIKTAYFTGFNRLILLAESGKIGDIVSVDSTCTSLRKGKKSLFSWGPIALLPVFSLLGTNYRSKHIVSKYFNSKREIDGFTKIDFTYDNAVASIKVANEAKSEGELIITGTKGYIYVPSPWWKTDYFELRYENTAENRRFFYQLDGEGIRYEIAAFANQIEHGHNAGYLSNDIVVGISKIMEDYSKGKDLTVI